MLALGAPVFLVAAAVAAAIVVVLHLLAWRRPVPTALPTARFIPDAPVRAVSRAVRLTDAALLAVRVLALLAIGLALAQPRLTNTPRARARVVLADHSRAVASVAELRDSVASVSRGVDLVQLISFDSTAAPVLSGDSAGLARSDRRGNLSAGLVMALREAERLSHDFIEVDVVVVSPLVREELDAATARIRALWPGTLRVARVAARDTETGVSPAEPALPPVGDPIGAAMRLALAPDSFVQLNAGIRVVRGAAGAADSAAARGGALVVVAPDAPLDSSRLAAVTTGRHTVIAPLHRMPNGTGGRAVAWWGDGTVAAAEHVLGDGCLRDLGFLPVAAGDFVLRPAFVQVLRDLLGPCDAVDWRPVPATELSWITAPVVSGNVADRRSAGAAPASPSRALPLALLAFAFVALIAEWWLRRGSVPRAAGMQSGDRRDREAA